MLFRSNLNFDAGDTVANRAIVKLGTGGRVTIYNLAGDGTVTFRDTERAPRSSVENSREFPDVPFT